MEIASHVITLDRAGARFRRFQQINAHLGCQVFDAIRGQSFSQAERLTRGYVTREALNSGAVSDARLGCALSHHALWQLSASTGRPLLILEDDVATHPALLAYIKAADLRDKDMVSFGVNTNSVLHSVSPEGLEQVTVYRNEHPSYEAIARLLAATSIGDVRMSRCLRRFGNCCYLVTPQGARKLVERFFPLRLEGVPIPLVTKHMPGTGADRRLNALFDGLEAHVTLPFLAYVPNLESAINPPQANALAVKAG